jgi:hypothetical protein
VLLAHVPILTAALGVCVAAAFYVVARLVRSQLDINSAAVIVLAAWIGQHLVLATGVLADELTPSPAVYFWILATGGPLQPRGLGDVEPEPLESASGPLAQW